MSTLPNNLKLTDLHVHLHGCLTADDVFLLGGNVWQNRQSALQWFADEYLASCGRQIFPATYWTEANGRERLQKDFEFKTAGSFPEFQAHFNLLIALFPITPDDATILEQAAARDLLDGTLGHREYRIFLPPRFTASEIWLYLDSHAHALQKMISQAAAVQKPDLTIAVSMSRDPALLHTQYRALKEWQDATAAKKDPALSRITGIDFCGEEAAHSPAQLEPFMRQVRADNIKNPTTALALLVHVGEQWHDMAPEQAIQAVLDASRGGAHRLGHALAIGVDPTLLAAAPTNKRKFTAARFASLQKSARQELRDRGGIIEVCPTANQRLSGAIDPMTTIPMLIEDRIPFVIGSDNPGMLATTLAREWQTALDQLSKLDLNSGMLEAARRSRSSLCCGRESVSDESGVSR